MHTLPNWLWYFELKEESAARTCQMLTPQRSPILLRETELQQILERDETEIAPFAFLCLMPCTHSHLQINCRDKTLQLQMTYTHMQLIKYRQTETVSGMLSSWSLNTWQDDLQNDSRWKRKSSIEHCVITWKTGCSSTLTQNIIMTKCQKHLSFICHFIPFILRSCPHSWDLHPWKQDLVRVTKECQ